MTRRGEGIHFHGLMRIRWMLKMRLCRIIRVHLAQYPTVVSCDTQIRAVFITFSGCAYLIYFYRGRSNQITGWSIHIFFVWYVCSVGRLVAAQLFRPLSSSSLGTSAVKCLFFLCVLCLPNSSWRALLSPDAMHPPRSL